MPPFKADFYSRSSIMVFTTHPPAAKKNLDFCPTCGEWIEGLPKVGRVTCPQCDSTYTYHRTKCDRWVDMSTWKTLSTKTT